MLSKTFIHIPGVGQRMERSLWRQGCSCWADLLEGLDRFSYGTAERDAVHRTMTQSMKALDQRRHQYFARKLGMREAWRAYREFSSDCVYLDIETDGGSSPDSITVIGLYDNKGYVALIRGENLENFRDLISHYAMIVTFFGTGFDLPILKKRFSDVKFDQIHIDLCSTLRRIGIRGGLKRIEHDFGIQREPGVEGLSGYDAVKLWRKYIMLGDENARETLIAYNKADVVSLKPLAEHAFVELCSVVEGHDGAGSA